MYTLPFVVNKKLQLNVEFDEAVSLRSFFEKKLMNLSKFTTLPFINQVEIVMNDIPVEIQSLFILNGKMTGDKTKILKFCDAIQGLVVENEKETAKERPNENDREPSQPSDKMQMYDLLSEAETSEADSMSVDSPQSSSKSGRGRGRSSANGTARGIKKRGRPSKKLLPIKENEEAIDNYDFLKEMDSSSQSTWSEKN